MGLRVNEDRSQRALALKCPAVDLWPSENSGYFLEKYDFRAI
jgi:hypothetical protein